MRGVALTLRQPSCAASDKVCGFQRQRNLYMELFLRQSLRVLRTEGRRPKELKSILREINFISNTMYINSRTQTAQNTLNLLFFNAIIHTTKQINPQTLSQAAPRLPCGVFALRMFRE